MNTLNKKKTIFLIAALFCVNQIFSQVEPTPPSDNSTQFDLAREMLIASGVTEKLPEYLSRLQDLKNQFLFHIDELKKSQTLTYDFVAEEGLKFLYSGSSTLQIYSTYQTRIDLALDTHKYNCVSSTLLYLYLMDAAGIECKPVETPQHAFCQVYIPTKDGSKPRRVETTNPYGYDPTTKKVDPENFNRYYKVPVKHYAQQKCVSPQRAVSLIYLNRVAECSRKNQMEQAYKLSLDAFKLQNGNQIALKELQGSASNYLLWLGQNKQYSKGLEFSRQFKNEFGLSKDCQTNTNFILSKNLNNLMERKNFQEAKDLLEQNQDLISQTDYNNLMEVVICNFISAELAKHPGYKNSMDLLDKYSDYLPPIKIKAYKTNITRNAAVEIHNSIIPLINSRQFSEARKIVENGIEQIGEHSILLNDLRYLKQFE